MEGLPSIYKGLRGGVVWGEDNEPFRALIIKGPKRFGP